MMRFYCESCGQKIRVPEKHVGRKGKCPKCKNIINIPQAGKLVSFKCTMCNENMKISESSRGKLLECPSCGCYAEVPTRDNVKLKPSISRNKNQVQHKNENKNNSSNYSTSNTGKKISKEVKTWIFVFVCFVFIIISLICWSFKEHEKIRRISKSTEAVIISNRVEMRHHGGRSSGPIASTTYKPIITLEYKVDDTIYSYEHELNRPSGAKKWEAEHQARQYLQRFYPKGKHIKIFYNPNNPNEALLVRKVTSVPQWIIGFAVICFFTACLCQWMAKKGWINFTLYRKD